MSPESPPSEAPHVPLTKRIRYQARQVVAPFAAVAAAAAVGAGIERTVIEHLPAPPEREELHVSKYLPPPGIGVRSPRDVVDPAPLGSIPDYPSRSDEQSLEGLRLSWALNFDTLRYQSEAATWQGYAGDRTSEDIREFIVSLSNTGEFPIPTELKVPLQVEYTAREAYSNFFEARFPGNTRTEGGYAIAESLEAQSNYEDWRDGPPASLPRRLQNLTSADFDNLERWTKEAEQAQAEARRVATEIYGPLYIGFDEEGAEIPTVTVAVTGPRAIGELNAALKYWQKRGLDTPCNTPEHPLTVWVTNRIEGGESTENAKASAKRCEIVVEAGITQDQELYRNTVGQLNGVYNPDTVFIKKSYRLSLQRYSCLRRVDL